MFTAGPSRFNLVGNARSDVILVIGELHRKLAQRLHQFRVCQHVTMPIVGGARPREYTHRYACVVRRITGPLKAFPRQFEEHALLWVNYFGPARRDTEEARIECICIVHDAARHHIVRIVPQPGWNRGVQCFRRESRNQVTTCQQVLPELFHRSRTREAARHAYNGDAFH